jgi:branched-chain amino acid transport system permease protein
MKQAAVDRPTISAWRGHRRLVRATQRTRYRGAIVVGALAVGYAFVGSNSNLFLGTTIFIAAVGAIALNALTGNLGIVSLGQAAFLATGAFTATYLGGTLHWPFLLVLLASGVAAGLVGGIVGVPSLRWRGLYIILGTFALHYIVVYGATKYEINRVGPGGFNLPPAKIFSWTITSQRDWYLFSLVLVALTVACVAKVLRGRTGRAWTAVRDRDLAASITGIDVSRAKVVGFIATSFVVGVAGATSAYFVGNVTTETFTLNLAIQYVAMIIIGGLGSVPGAVVGAAFVVYLPHMITKVVGLLPSSYPLAGWVNTNIFDLEAGLYGVFIILFLLLEPGGLVALAQRVRRYFVSWPFRDRGVIA